MSGTEQKKEKAADVQKKETKEEEETQRGCTAAELARRDCRWGLDPNMPLPFPEFLRGPGDGAEDELATATAEANQKKAKEEMK